MWDGLSWHTILPKHWHISLNSWKSFHWRFDWFNFNDTCDLLILFSLYFYSDTWDCSLHIGNGDLFSMGYWTETNYCYWADSCSFVEYVCVCVCLNQISKPESRSSKLKYVLSLIRTSVRPFGNIESLFDHFIWSIEEIEHIFFIRNSRKFDLHRMQITFESIHARSAKQYVFSYRF
jgi:hypothetical protein